MDEWTVYWQTSPHVNHEVQVSFLPFTHTIQAASSSLEEEPCKAGSCSHHKLSLFNPGENEIFSIFRKHECIFVDLRKVLFGNLSREYNQNHLSFKNRSIALGGENRFCFREEKLFRAPALRPGRSPLKPHHVPYPGAYNLGKSFLAKSSENSNLPSLSTRCKIFGGNLPSSGTFSF
ncbi:hypothetical protein CEXT_322811 [Caerostris extrusa]|uniref:Uncharacterized protein n=1 Tax=Caerostris extrusa TaxID=172846 RepID=A0AAV4Y5R7_CAEEX|nr:hypothetical protein CEXT_322811 [Caerostris extrusa]